MDLQMLTQECRARQKQAEAEILEVEKKYNKASELYSIAKVIWQRLTGTRESQKFCDDRKRHCEAMSLTVDQDDDDDEY